jgi:elongation factor P
MANISELRKNLKIVIAGTPFVVTECNFVKPGKGTGFSKCKIKNLLTGAVLDRTWRSGESVEIADTENREMQFIYQEGSHFIFMDNETYEQIPIEEEVLKGQTKFLIDELKVDVLFFNEKAVGVELPIFVEIQITFCEPGVKGDTAQGGTKPATLSTGAIINVPLFVHEGEWIKIDTRTSNYVERVKK